MKIALAAAVLAAAFRNRRIRPVRQPNPEKVKKDGYLKCGVSDGLAGFSNPDAQGNQPGWTWMCRRIAAAIFDDPNAVCYTSTTAKERFTALQSGEFDLLAQHHNHHAARRGAGPRVHERHLL